MLAPGDDEAFAQSYLDMLDLRVDVET